MTSVLAYGENDHPEITLCLAMVVDKHTAHLEETLESVKELIDYVSIVDQGSPQGTQELVKTFLEKNGIRGKIESDLKGVDETIDPDSAALLIAKKRLTDEGFSLDHTFLLTLKANQILNQQPSFRKELLKSDAYLVREKSSEFSSYQIHLLRASLPWKKKGGTLYGYWTHARGPFETAAVLRDWTINDRHETHPEEIEKDLKLVAEALKEEPDNEHLLFYLARLNQLQHHYEKAIQVYQDRIAFGGNPEEVWCSKQMMGECYEALGQWERALPSYMEAFQHNINRAEPLYRLARYYRSKGHTGLAHLFAKRAATILYPSEQNLFINDPVYDYLIDEELCRSLHITRHSKMMD